MSKAAESLAFGNWREVRVGAREQTVENGKGEMESVSWERKWGPKEGGESRKMYLSLDQERPELVPVLMGRGQERRSGVESREQDVQLSLDIVGVVTY